MRILRYYLILTSVFWSLKCARNALLISLLINNNNKVHFNLGKEHQKSLSYQIRCLFIAY